MTALAFLLALGAVSCGGGGGGGDNSTPGNPTTPTTPGTPSSPSTPGEPSSPSTPSEPSTPSNPSTPGTPFTAFLSSADAMPADGAAISGTVPLVVRGTAMANVELLPSDGFEPKVMVLDISQDHAKASGSLDTTRLPNGTLTVRLVAFDGQIGQPASQITAMPVRTWHVQNNWAVPNPLSSTPRRADFVIPPPSVMPEVWVRAIDLPYVDPKALNDLLARLRGATYQDTVKNFADDMPAVLSVMYQYVPAHARLLGTAPHANLEGWWNNCVQQGNADLCVQSAMLMASVMQSYAPR